MRPDPLSSADPPDAASAAGDDPAPGEPPRVHLAGLDFHALTEADCVARIVAEAGAGRGGWVVTPNSDILRLCRRDRSLHALVRRAELTVADGMPLIWASRLQGTPLPERVCGSDLVWSVAEAAAAAQRSLFLLGGGREDTAERAAAILRERNPGLRIAGTHFPPFGFERDEAQLAAIERALADARPDIVYVALSVPKAERLIERLRERFPTTWWIGVGISLSFICGEVPRAPRWMQRGGLEWLHRMGQEPGRLAKRYLWHDLPFVARLLAGACLKRLKRAPSA